MWARAAARGLLVGLCALLAIASPARAGLPTADVAFKVRTQGQAALNQTATVEIERHSYGPQPTTTGFVTVELKAPGGTVFDATFERSLGRGYYDCQWFSAHRHVRCKVDGMIYPDDDNPSGTYSFYVWRVSLVVKARCTTAGSARISYGGDPKTANNAVTIRVSVPGVTASDCAPKPTPSATPKPTPTATATATSTPTPTPSPDPAVVISDSGQALPAASLAAESSTTTLPTMAAVGGGVAATALAFGAAVWWLRRRQRQTP